MSLVSMEPVKAAVIAMPVVVAVMLLARSVPLEAAPMEMSVGAVMALSRSITLVAPVPVNVTPTDVAVILLCSMTGQTDAGCAGDRVVGQLGINCPIQCDRADGALAQSEAGAADGESAGDVHTLQ